MVPAATVRQGASQNQVQRVRMTPMTAPGPVALVYRARNRNTRVDLLRAALGLAPDTGRDWNAGAICRRLWQSSAR